MNNTNTSPIAAQPEISTRTRISAIWLLPILALFLGGYLVYQSIHQAGIVIEIHFPDGEGIIEGKTPIKYKGLTVGLVKKLQPERLLSGVKVIVEMDPRAEPTLNTGTQFWLVKPQASLTRISGLETILSGNYIGIQPGEGKKTHQFEATKEPPLQISDSDLLVSLFSEDLGSINVGSPVYFRHIAVGEVVRVQLNEYNRQVLIQLQIQSEYRDLVNSDSRFWNVSGLQVKANFSNIEIQTESLATLIAGGIAFDSPATGKELAADQTFKLFPSLKTANRGVKISLRLPAADGLSLTGTEIRYLGVPIGRVDQFELSQDNSFVEGDAYIDPTLSSMLGDDSQFWLVKPQLSLQGIENLDALLGYRIQFSPAATPSLRRNFTIESEPPAPFGSLRVQLLAPESYGLTVNEPVTYRGIPIGKVMSLELVSSEQIGVNIQIASEYRKHIHKDSRFHISSGLNIKASMQGIKIQSHPLENFLIGGVSLYQVSDDGEPINDGDSLTLFADEEAAIIGKVNPPVEVNLITDSLNGLQVGSPVYFKELQVGSVKDVQLMADQNVLITLTIKARHASFFNQSTRFWRVGGVKVKASLSGLEVETGPLMALAIGGVAFETPEPNALQASEKNQPLYNSREDAFEPRTAIQIKVPVQSQLKQGSPVRYGGFDIGEVAQIKLDPGLNHLIAKVFLHPDYADSFSRESALFWLASAEISINGIKNPSALITGDFIASRPGTGAKQTEFQAASREPLPHDSSQGLVIYLESSSLGSISEGAPLLFRKMVVGKVLGAELSPNSQKVIIQAQVVPEYAHLVRANSVFWNVSGISAEIGLFTGVQIHAETAQTIIRGGIAFTTPDDIEQPAAQFGSRFNLHDKAEDEWLH